MARWAVPGPAIQLNGMLWALSSTSSCTVSVAAALRGSALARGEHPVDFGRVGFGTQGFAQRLVGHQLGQRSEEHTSELQSLMRISYAVFCLKKKKYTTKNTDKIRNINII